MDTNAFQRPKLRTRRWLPATAIFATGLVLAGCATMPDTDAGAAASGTSDVAAQDTQTQADESQSTESQAASATQASSSPALDALAAENEDGTVVREDEWSVDDAVQVELAGDGAAATTGVASADGTVTISAAGVYSLSGELSGRVVVAAPEDAQVVLLLNGASITSGNGPAIEVQTADDVAIHLAEGTSNTVVDTTSYADDADANAAIFSEHDLTVSGTGALHIDAAGDGLTSEDDLAIIGGALTVTAADEALRGKDSVQVEDGTLALEAGGDAIQSDNVDEAGRGWIRVEGGSITATAQDDAFNAVSDILITGGTIAVAAGGDGLHADVAMAIADGTISVTDANEGLEAARMVLDGGTIDVTAVDDAINGSAGAAAGGGMTGPSIQVEITGGDITLRAGGDGLDSNGTALVTGGTVTAWGPEGTGNAALDASSGLTVNGGTVFAAGSSRMATAPGADSTQGWLQALVDGQAGSTIEIRAADGTVLASATAEGAFENVVFSSAGLSGDVATVVVDGQATEVALGQATGGGGFGRP